MAEATDVPSEPYANEWLEAETMLGGRFVLHGSVHDIRQQFAALFESLASKLPPPSDAVTTQDIECPGRGQRVRVYTPKLAPHTKDVPIGLYIHSGGFVTGAIENEDHLARDIAERVPMVLVSTSYRLAPEQPFPTGLEDCIRAYEWIWANASQFSASSDKVIVMGGSAGANLACAVVLSVVEKEPILKPKGLIMACSSTIHPSVIPEEYNNKEFWNPERLADSALLDRISMMTCMDQYGASPAEPLWSILLNPNLSKLPRTWLVVCTKDPTYDDLHMFDDKLTKEGVEVSHYACRGYPHFFWMLPMLEKSQELMVVNVEDMHFLAL